MGCTIKFLIKKYNSDTEEVEISSVNLFDVDQNESLTLQEVTDRLLNLDSEARSQLANTLRSISYHKLPSNYLRQNKIDEFIGNSSVSDLSKEYGIQLEDYGLNPEDYNDIIVISSMSFQKLGQAISGRLLDATGKPVFVVKNKYDAAKFFKYLASKQKIEQMFTADGELKSDYSEYAEDVKLIKQADSKSFTGEESMTVKDILITYLDNKSMFSKDIVKDGKVVKSLDKLLSKFVHSVLEDIDYGQNYTDLETSLKNSKTTTKDKFSWQFSKKTFYDIIKTYFPNIEFSYDDFKAMTLEQIQNILYKNNGLFLGNPRLERADIKFDITDNKTQTVVVKSSKESQQIWEKIREKLLEEVGNNSDLPQETIDFVNGLQKQLSDIPQKQVDSTVNLISLAEGSFTWEGDQISVKTTTKNNTKKIVFSKIINGDDTTNLDIILDFGYKRIGEIYDMAYDTTQIFSPVNDEASNVVNGEYNGMYVYVANRNGINNYAVSKNIFSPNAKMVVYPTLEAAKQAIDIEIASAELYTSAYSFSLNKVGPDVNIRDTIIEAPDINVGQILTVVNYGVDPFEFKKLPPCIQQILRYNKSNPNFGTFPFLRNFLDEAELDPDHVINTPEKAGAFILKFYQSLGNEAKGTLVNLDFLKSPDLIQEFSKGLKNNQEIANKIINDIKNAKIANYIVKDAFTIDKKKKDRKHVILNRYDINGETKGLFSQEAYKQTINQTLVKAVEYLSNLFGTKDMIQVLSAEQLKIFSEQHNIGIEDRLNSVKAFIYDGKIYINQATATEQDLYHEIAHLCMGILKVKNSDEYINLLNSYSQTSETMWRFKNKYDYMADVYSNLAEQDIVEETVADLIAEDIYRNSGMIEGFESKVFNKVLSTVFQAIKTQKTAEEDNGLGFTKELKSLLNGVAEESKRNRMITNILSEMIEKGDIKENCK